MTFTNAVVLNLSVSLALFAPVAVVTPAHAQMSQSQIEEQLTCQCGCGLTVASCNHLQCGFRNPLREEISTRLGEGETGEAIIDDFVERYGEKILSSPTTDGFNLLAWTGPYIAIFVAGALIMWRFGMFSRRKDDDTDGGNTDGGEAGGAQADGSDAINTSDRQRIERELGEI